jgi:hypothetical protein
VPGVEDPLLGKTTLQLSQRLLTLPTENNGQPGKKGFEPKRQKQTPPLDFAVVDNCYSGMQGLVYSAKSQCATHQQVLMGESLCSHRIFFLSTNSLKKRCVGKKSM